MSLAKIREAAKDAPGAFVSVTGAELKAALEEHGEKPDKGSLLEHVTQKVQQNPECVMQVHRDVHLGNLLGVKTPVAVTPGTSTVKT